MSKTIIFPYPTDASSMKNLPVSIVDGTTLSVISDEPQEVVESSQRASFDAPEVFSFGRKPMNDVYSQSGIAIANRPSSNKGVKLLIKSEQIISVTDTEDSTYLKYLPFTVNFTIVAPVNELITSDIVLQVAKRAAGALLSAGTAVDSTRIAALIRGSLKA